MPVYNGSEYVRQSVFSILNQTYKDFEFLIIDDGSTDDTADIINSIKDERIIYKKIEHAGTAAALNYGIKISKGDWIARIDSDDLNTKTRLECQIEFIKEHPEYDVISSRSIYFNDSGNILFFWDVPKNDVEIKNSRSH